jgi:multiple sugar transport system substrate-binding protein
MSNLEERRLTRRSVMRGLGLAGAGVLGASLLAACGASATTTGTTAAESTGAATTKAASSAAATTSAATASAATTSSASKTVAAAATSSTEAVIGQNPTGAKGVVTWLTRTGVSETTWEQKVAVPDFEKANPSIKVNLIIAPWAQFDPKLFTLFAADTPVDVWTHWGQSGFADYVHKGMVADLTSLIAADHYDLTAFQPGMTDIYKLGGKQLGLPNDTTYGMPLYYDADMLQKAGITPPGVDWTKPWSWAEMVDAAKKMTTNYGAPTATYGISLPTDLQLLARLGGIDLFTWDVVNTGIAKPADYHADAPEVLAGVQAVYDLMYKDKVMPTPQLNNALGAGGLDPFVAQKLAMTWNGGWDYWNYKPEIKSFKWPAAADPMLKTNNTTEYTDPWMLSSKSKDQSSAWTFVKYLLSYDGQLAYMNATGAPPANAKAAEQWLTAFQAPTGLTTDQLKQVTSGALTHGKESFNHLLVNYNEYITAENNALNQVWSGKLSPSDGLKQAKDQVDAVLSKQT